MIKAMRIYASLSILLAAALLLFFFVLSCHGNEDRATRVGIVYDTVGKKDRSFNESAYEGAKRAEAELGISLSEETTRGTDREELIRSLAGTTTLL